MPPPPVDMGACPPSSPDVRRESVKANRERERERERERDRYFVREIGGG
jgi:hypothetical protein